MVYVDAIFILCSVSQVGQDGGLSSRRQEFEPPTEYHIEPMLISNINFGNLKGSSLAKLKF